MVGLTMLKNTLAEGDTDSEQIFNQIMDEVENYQNRGSIETYPR